MTRLSAPAEKEKNGRKTPRSASQEPPQYPTLKKALSASFGSRSPSPAQRVDFDGALPPDNLQNVNESHTLERPLESPRASQTLSIKIPEQAPSAGAAFKALQYLPIPLIVLSSRKTIMLANEAMARLLGLDAYNGQDRTSNEGHHTESAPADLLLGQTLSQIGVEMLQSGQRIWVSWEKFLDNLTQEMDLDTVENNEKGRSASSTTDGFKDDGSSSDSQTYQTRPTSKADDRHLVHDSMVNVILSSRHTEKHNGSPRQSRTSPAPEGHVQANMIISIWRMDGQRYYTCTFTSTTITPLSPMGTHSRTVSRTAASLSFTDSSPSSPLSPNRCTQCGSGLPPSSTTSPFLPPSSTVPFPPLGAPAKSGIASSPAVLKRLDRMKDAITDAIEYPVFVMWHDESLTIPNKAAAQLIHQAIDPTSEDTYNVLSTFKVFTEDFKRPLEPEEYPIVKLCRTRKPFSGWRVGIIHPSLGRRRYDVSGKLITDSKTGEFQAGMISLKDVTEYTDMLKAQDEQNDQQFQLICDSMPQMLWTTTADGSHDWFSRRWYDYTGLSVEVSLGEGWVDAFHPEDIPEASRRWKHSLATGDEYSTEYRCFRHDGAARWFLGRALPLRDTKTGQIIKWFGTCTDIHDSAEARKQAKRMREQLLNVIRHASVTVWVVNQERTLIFLEGKLMWDPMDQHITEDSIGHNVYNVFGRNQGRIDLPIYKDVIEQILNGEGDEQIREHHINGNGRWFRTRFVPMQAQKGLDKKPICEGVIGISMDVTEVKKREEELRTREKENIRLLSAETAAKEASRLKSQFLANMSHEIRTPIAGVIGMSEILLDTDLDAEQRDSAENIQRSANGLLTVINDILDLSKVESGRLDIEEVQFSLSVVIGDVCKMLSFAAERKNLVFESDVQVGTNRALIVMGDPGRVRQILTNLLTNSIKFTSEGSVKLSVEAKKETAEAIEVLFAVEDTGIGIEEEVRKKLFKPFSQADSSTARRFGGTGLGLTICKNLVDLMHGEISLESALGSGTKATFWIPFNKPQFGGSASPLVDLGSIPERLKSELSVSGCTSDNDQGSRTPSQSPQDQYGITIPPRHQRSNSLKKRPQARAPSPGQDNKSNEQNKRKLHVLVVEDNDINQKIAMKTVKKFGYSVNAVWNGQQALDYLIAKPSPTHPKPDIILMDVQMPLLDGYQATHRIRHHKPYANIESVRTIPIVAMTASAIQGDKEKCQAAGMDDYLAKPVKGATLETKLRKWAIEGQRAGRLEPLNDLHDDETPCDDRPLSITGSLPSNQSPPSTDNPKPQITLEPDSLHGLDKTEGDRGLQRVEAEEKATALRDEKLLAASEAHPSTSATTIINHTPPQKSPAMRPGLPRARLTEENITKLDRQQGSNELHMPKLRYEGSREGDSMAVAGGTKRDTDRSGLSTVESFDGAGGGGGGEERGMGMGRRQASDVTVTSGNVGEVEKA